MRYLKKFNEELKAATYKSAANKLRKYGHNRRADKLLNKYHDVAPIEIKNDWEILVKEYSKYGKIKVEFIHTQGALEPYIIECYFLINLYRDGVEIPVLNDEYKFIYLPLEISVIPTNIDDFYLLQELFCYDMPQAYYNLFKMDITLKLRENNWGVTNVFFSHQSGVELPDYFDYGIYDRGSAGRLSMAIKKIFNHNLDYPSGNKYEYKETLYDEINRIFFIESGISSECGIAIENVGEYLNKNLNANLLFQN